MLNRRNLLKTSSLLLLLQKPQLSFGASIVAVRMWPADEYTRITLESDHELTATYLLLDNPYRMAIDVNGLKLNETLKNIVNKIIANDPFVKSVRVGQFSQNVVRIVLDLKQAIKPQVFSLPPVANYKNRIVFDLYPFKEVDPLEELIVSLQQPSTKPDDSTLDPLKDILTEINKKQQSTKPTEPIIPTPAPEVAKKTEPKPTSQSKQEAIKAVNDLVIVAIDPGHGGEDPGAIGPKKVREKDVVLKIALKLRSALNKRKNMRAVLTRDADFFVPLNTRVTKARRLQADIFISIHADAFTKPEANGISVFALSTSGASSSMARFLANKENQSDLIGGANIHKKNQQVSKLLLEYSTAAQIQQSISFGGILLNELDKVGRLHKKYVERAGFAVLKAPDITSVLVETGFITNPQEEQRLNSAAYQNKIVAAISDGIDKYIKQNPRTRKNRRV